MTDLFTPHTHNILFRVADPTSLGGYFHTLESYVSGGDSHIELWERQQEDKRYYYFAWYVSDVVVRIAQYKILAANLMGVFVVDTSVKEAIVQGFIRACRGQYEIGVYTLGLWINAGEERMDRHQILAANRFEDEAEISLEPDEQYGVITGGSVIIEGEILEDDSDIFSSFVNEELEIPEDGENPDIGASETDDE